MLLGTVVSGVFSLYTDFFGKNGLTDLACSEDMGSTEDSRVAGVPT